MRMLVKCSVMMLGAASLVMAQHGGHGGGGGGHASGGGGFHASAPAARSSYSSGFNSGYQTSITPQSYSGHLTLSTPSPYVGSSAYNRGAIAGARPVWSRPPIRRPGRYPYYGGVGLYPYIGYGYGLGYYGDDYFANDYYANNYDPGAYYAPQEQPQYQPYYGGDRIPTPAILRFLMRWIHINSRRRTTLLRAIRNRRPLHRLLW